MDDPIGFDIRYVAHKTLWQWLDENCYDIPDFGHIAEFCEMFLHNYYRAEMEEFARNEGDKNKGRSK
jgi:hypothetical protein